MELIRKEYEIETIGPVHIGSGEKRKPFEYVYDWRKSPTNGSYGRNSNGRGASQSSSLKPVLFLNESKWIWFLEKKRLMDDFAGYVIGDAERQRDSRPKQKSIMQWMLDHRISFSEVERLAMRRAMVDGRDAAGLSGRNDSRRYGAASSGNKKKSLNEIAMAVALADGRPYIPGSSIKGALRTGILWSVIVNQKDSFHKEWSKLKETLEYHARNKHVADKLGFVTKEIETNILHVLGVSEKQSDAVNSVLRGLSVSDAPAGKYDTVVIRGHDALPPRGGERVSNDLPLFRECIPADSRLRFSITADFSILKKIGLTSMEQIWEKMHAYTQESIRLREKVFGDAYRDLFDEAEEADIILGGGTGFLSKTLVYALAPDEEEAREFTAKYLNTQFSGDHHLEKDIRLSPRTLKLARHDVEAWIMGLCRINEVCR